jgi:hypothetical protein
MIKEALQYIIGLGNVETHEIDSQVFSTQKLHLVPSDAPNTLQVRSLSGLVDYLISEFDTDKFSKRMIQVVSPTEVVVYSSFNRDYQRNEYIKATAMLTSFVSRSSP